jgi:hypothetical protein
MNAFTPEWLAESPAANKMRIFAQNPSKLGVFQPDD